jgi:hypothetical protein
VHTLQSLCNTNTLCTNNTVYHVHKRSRVAAACTPKMKSYACSYNADSNFDAVHAVKVMSRPCRIYRSEDMTMYVSPRQDDKQDLKVFTTAVISTHSEITITTRSTSWSTTKSNRSLYGNHFATLSNITQCGQQVTFRKRISATMTRILCMSFVTLSSRTILRTS